MSHPKETKPQETLWPFSPGHSNKTRSRIKQARGSYRSVSYRRIPPKTSKMAAPVSLGTKNHEAEVRTLKKPRAFWHQLKTSIKGKPFWRICNKTGLSMLALSDGVTSIITAYERKQVCTYGNTHVPCLSVLINSKGRAQIGQRQASRCFSEYRNIPLSPRNSCSTSANLCLEMTRDEYQALYFKW